MTLLRLTDSPNHLQSGAALWNIVLDYLLSLNLIPTISRFSRKYFVGVFVALCLVLCFGQPSSIAQAQPNLQATPLLSPTNNPQLKDLPPVFATPLKESETFEKLRAAILGQVPGLTNRHARFYILVDGSGSGGKLYSVYGRFLTYLSDTIFNPKDEICVIPFARHAKAEDGSNLTSTSDIKIHQFNKSTINDLLPTTSFNDQGTDLDEPVYYALKHALEDKSATNEVEVVLLLTDASRSDRGTISPDDKFFVDLPGKRAELRQLEQQFNSDSEKTPREFPSRYRIQDTPGILNFDLRYRNNLDDLPPETDIDRLQITDSHGRSIPTALTRASFSEGYNGVTFHWQGDPKYSYVLFLSNNNSELAQAWNNQQTEKVRRIELPPSAIKSSSNSQLQAAVPFHDIEEGGIVDTTKNTFFSISPLNNGKLMPTEGLIAPFTGAFNLPPQTPKQRYLPVAELVTLCIFLLLIAHHFLSQVYARSIKLADSKVTYDIKPTGGGLPIRSGRRPTASTGEQRDSNALYLPYADEDKSLPSTLLGRLSLNPQRLMPHKFRNQVVLNPAQGAKGKQITLKDGENTLKFPAQEPRTQDISRKVVLLPQEQKYRTFLLVQGMLFAALLVSALAALSLAISS